MVSGATRLFRALAGRYAASETLEGGENVPDRALNALEAKIEGLFSLREGESDMGKKESLPRVKKIETTDGSGLYRVTMSTFPRLRLLLN